MFKFHKWRSRMPSAALALALVVGTYGGAAESASARQTIAVKGAGVAGQVILDDGPRDAGLRGFVRDTDPADGQCAEIWMDFTTRPHHHFDAYVVRICSGRAGWGRYNKAGSRWGWRINGARTAACTWSPASGKRKCTQQWAHDSVKAGTFRLKWI